MTAMHQQIIQYLEPLLGETTAKNILSHYCIRLHISAKDLQPAQVPELADSMRPMLAVWLGSEGAARVAQELAQLGQEASRKGALSL